MHRGSNVIVILDRGPGSLQKILTSSAVVGRTNLREIEEEKSKPFGLSTMQYIVQRMRKKLKRPSTFTLDACRHGGMTELEALS